MACRLVGAKPLSTPMLEHCLIQTLGTNCCEVLSEISTFSFKKMHLKMSSGKWPPFCLGLNVLNIFIIQSFEIQTFSFKQLHLNMLFANIQPFWLTHWPLRWGDMVVSSKRNLWIHVEDEVHEYFLWNCWKVNECHRIPSMINHY